MAGNFVLFYFGALTRCNLAFKLFCVLQCPLILLNLLGQICNLLSHGVKLISFFTAKVSELSLFDKVKLRLDV